MKNMNEMLEQFVLVLAEKMGKKYDVTASLTWTETFGPTVRAVENIEDPKNGAWYISTGTIHESTCGHKAIFTVSVPKNDVEDYVMEWVTIEVPRLDWDPDGFRHRGPLYKLPRSVLVYAEDLEETLQVSKAAPEIIKDFQSILEEVKASEHTSNMKELGLL